MKVALEDFRVLGCARGSGFYGLQMPNDQNPSFSVQGLRGFQALTVQAQDLVQGSGFRALGLTV